VAERVGDELTYMSRANVARALPPVEDQIDLVERVYRAMAAGRVELPPKPGIHPRADSFIHAMPAYLADDDVAAIKWISGYPMNKNRGLPYISGLIVLNDPETGQPQCVMDGAEITAQRTAAASGVCVRHFAPIDWHTVALLGCGEQGRCHLRVLSALNPAARFRAYDPDPERAAGLPGRVTPVATPEEALEEADIVVTAGPILTSPEPVITPAWLADSYLALPLDFDSYVHAEAVQDADLFLVDDAGQFEYYRSLGHFQQWPEPVASVGEALQGTRTSARRVVCCNLGVAAVDAAFAHAVRVAAKDDGELVHLPR